MFKRAEYQTITNRLKEDRRFIQVLMGPRQVGKSTVVKQVLKDLERPYQFFSADNVPATNSIWVLGDDTFHDRNTAQETLKLIVKLGFKISKL